MTGWGTPREVGMDNPRTRSFDATPWVTPKMAARAFGRSEQTIYTWMRQGAVRSMCLTRGRTLVVFWPDVSKASDTCERRLRLRKKSA